jgi:hypothetical protein
MAASLCHGALPAPAQATFDCHSQDVESPPRGDVPACPIGDSLPDFAKLPAIAPRPNGDELAELARRVAVETLPAQCAIRPRDGPDLDALCRLLI